MNTKKPLPLPELETLSDAELALVTGGEVVTGPIFQPVGTIIKVDTTTAADTGWTDTGYSCQAN